MDARVRIRIARMFRFICVVKFEDHKLISTETIDGD